MRSFIVKLEKFFKMDTGIQGSNFDSGKKKLVIPLYQREFKWENDKIINFIMDISNRDKFIGNIILDEKEDCYEIVDGQQRLTVCFLTLLCLYNCYEGKPREQESVLNILKPYGEFLFHNYSVGQFALLGSGKFSINIDNDKDIYYQKSDFVRAYDIIYTQLEELNSHDNLREFKRKLLDCELLILINNQHTNTSPIERVFLDINEKAQLLDVEDIFKGHCFENYDETYYDDLRDTWVELKKQGMMFTKFKFKDLSSFLYLYLLEFDSTDISEKLIYKRKHYLEGKDMDYTESLLKKMIKYGESITEVYNNLHNAQYRFQDVCKNSYAFRDTNDHVILKEMLKDIYDAPKQFQKLPLFFLLYSLKTDDELSKSITHKQFRGIITNLYVYASLFAYNSKRDVDHTVRDALKVQSMPNRITGVSNAAKQLRQSVVVEFENDLGKINKEKAFFVYSIIDFYKSDGNWLCKKYQKEDGYNLEHFLIPDIKSKCVTWVDDDNTFELQIKDEMVKANKKSFINYLVIDHNLNELLLHNDIIDKIDKINNWYDNLHVEMPKHVKMFVDKIVSMPEYMHLVSMKGKKSPQNDVREAYNKFLEAFFAEEKQRQTLGEVVAAFKKAFTN